jgi:hypothetical protein
MRLMKVRVGLVVGRGESGVRAKSETEAEAEGVRGEG